MRFAGSPAAQNALNAVSGISVDYNKLAGMGQESQSLQRRTAFDSQAKMKQAQDQAEAIIAQAEAGAAATQAQGTASMFGDIMGGISGLAGGLGGGGGGYVTPGGISTGMDKSLFAPTQLGVNHFNLSTGIPGVNLSR